MTKKRKSRNEELEVFHEEISNSFRDKKKSRTEESPFHEGVFDSFKDICPKVSSSKTFDLRDKFKNTSQRLAFTVYEQHDIMFLLGPAGTGKSFLACMFAIHDLLNERKSRIVMTRPIVEAGESLGYLPGTFSEKVDPYMMPLYDCIQKLVPGEGGWAKLIQDNSEVAPLAYLRGRTFDKSVCILDEAQNCTWGQLLLYLTRLGESSKLIITGDPAQSDIGRDSALMDVVHRLEGVEGIGMVRFTEEHIVRHRLVSEILKRLQRHS